MYAVVVGNIGTVYQGDDFEAAFAAFDEYVEQSKSGAGRAAGESVCLFTDDELSSEYEGSLDMEES